MVSPWIWSQSWNCSIAPPSSQIAGFELVEAIEQRGYTARIRFGVRLALEEELIKRIKEMMKKRNNFEVITETEIEILCRASTTDLELLIDGEIVFIGPLKNPSE